MEIHVLLIDWNHGPFIFLISLGSSSETLWPICACISAISYWIFLVALCSTISKNTHVAELSSNRNPSIIWNCGDRDPVSPSTSIIYPSQHGVSHNPYYRLGTYCLLTGFRRKKIQPYGDIVWLWLRDKDSSRSTPNILRQILNSPSIQLLAFLVAIRRPVR